MADMLIAALLLVGAFFGLVGSWGLVRLPQTMQRLHAPTKATTLGVGSLIIASMLFFAGSEHRLSLQELLLAIFLFITAPVSAHMMAKAALSLMMESRPEVPGGDREADDEKRDD